jgi:mono/diheme cytochrome c family protein
MANIPFELNEQVVAQGKPGTQMPGFAMVLSSEEIQDVIAYQRAFPKQ